MTREPRWRRAAQTAGTFCRDNLALVVLCLALLVAGCVLRIHDLGYPEGFGFDEDHFVKGARAYLSGREDRNDHPPLGKLLIALSMWFRGDDSVAWRTAPLVAGLLNVGLAFAIGRRVFESTRAGLLAAAFIAADGFLISYSRAALLDGMLTCATLCVVWLLVSPTRWWRAALAFALAGVAGSIKLSGHALLLPVIAVYLASPLPVWVMAFGLLSPLVFYAQFATGLALSAQPFSPRAVLEAAYGQLDHHLALNRMQHPDASRWYTWALPVRPLLLHRGHVGSDWLRVSSTMGNPLLWWSNVAASVALATKLAWEGPHVTLKRLRRGPTSRDGFVHRHLRGLAVLVMVWGTMLLPWVLTSRDSYILHYLPSHTLGLIVVAGAIGHLHQRSRVWALGYLAFVTVISAWYAPVWAGLEISPDALWLRLPPIGWH